MEKERAVIVDYVRTAFTKAVPPSFPPSDKAPGKLGDAKPADMVATLVQALLDRNATVKPEDIERVIVGCVHQEAEQGLNLARIAVLHPVSGLPHSVPAISLDMFCASSAVAIDAGKNSIIANDLDLVIAAGVQSMSKVPMGGFNPVMNPAVYDGNAKNFMNMPKTAENLAEIYNVTREEQDAFAVESHKRAAAAQAAGFFKHEIVEFHGIKDDDGIRADTNAETLGKLKTPFKNPGGTVTAGTSSQVTDGAAAVLMAKESYAIKNHLPIKAVILSYAEAGVAPEIMGIGPVEATKKALAKAGLTMADIDVVELNEAFAAQSLSVLAQFNKEGMAIDPAKVNIDGGAIALGHPLGASGARIAGHAAEILQRTGKRYGLATMCVGGGQGIAMVLENPNFAPKI